MSTNSGFFVFFVIYFIIAVIRGLSKPQKKNTGNTAAGRPVSSAARTSPPAARAPAPASRQRKTSGSEMGDIHHQYSHVNSKRVEQVNAYLKAGLIDKTEYRQMLERYAKEDQQFTDY